VLRVSEYVRPRLLLGPTAANQGNANSPGKLRASTKLIIDDKKGARALQPRTKPSWRRWLLCGIVAIFGIERDCRSEERALG